MAGTEEAVAAAQPDENPRAGAPPRPEHCELCERRVEALTRHHLIPRTRHRNKRTRRQFQREERHQRILWLCRPCHNHIHDVLSEKQLAEDHHSREALLAHPEVRRFVDWIRDRPATFRPASRSWKRRAR
jgi:hypothetical protein